MQNQGKNRNIPLTAMFRRPATPAASCLHLIRHLQPVARGRLVSGSGRSQPTVARAVSALMNAELVRERNDLTESQGPGRPSIPLELSPTPWVHIGVALGTQTTYIGAFNTHGVAVRETMLRVSPAQLGKREFLGILMTQVAELITATKLPAAGIGLSTSGKIGPGGEVTAPNLGWNKVPLAALLQDFSDLPITLADVTTAIAGAEQQAQDPLHPAKVLVFYADDTRGAALNSVESVNRLPVDASLPLDRAAASLVLSTSPQALVLAGSTFESPQEARKIAATLRDCGATPEIRIIPTHLDNARSAARAVALDKLMYDPLQVRQQVLMLTNEFII